MRWLACYLDESSPTLESFAKVVFSLARPQERPLRPIVPWPDATSALGIDGNDVRRAPPKRRLRHVLVEERHIYVERAFS